MEWSQVSGAWIMEEDVWDLLKVLVLYQEKLVRYGSRYVSLT